MPASPQAVRRRFWLWSQMWSQSGSIDASLVDHRRPSTGCRLALDSPDLAVEVCRRSDQLDDVEPTSKPTTPRDSPDARRIVRACEKATPALCPSFVDRPSSHRPTTLRALPNHQQERGYAAPLRSVSSLAALAAGAVLAADGPQRNDESVDLTQAEVKESPSGG